MGLGKTLEVLALVSSDADAARKSAEAKALKTVPEEAEEETDFEMQEWNADEPDTDEDPDEAEERLQR